MAWASHVTVSALVTLACLCSVSVSDHIESNRLTRKKIFTNYDRLVRPVKNASEAVNVTVEFSLGQIVDLSWKDDSLVWDPDEYNTSSVRVLPGEIWVPDIVVTNDVTDDDRDITTFLITVRYDGTVTYPYTVKKETQCEMNVEFFPYDTQFCNVQFASWSYSGRELNIKNNSATGNSKSYTDNGVWHLISIPVRRTMVVAEETYDQYEYPTLTYYVHIRRAIGYYNLNVISPALIIICISFCAFLLPVESGEKVSLVVTILLATTVYLLVIADSLPAQSKTVPTMGLYFVLVTGLMGLATLMTVFLICLHYLGTGNTPVPPLLRRVVLETIPRYIFLQTWIRQNLNDIQDSIEDRSFDTPEPGQSPQVQSRRQSAGESEQLLSEQNGLSNSEQKSLQKSTDDVTQKVVQKAQTDGVIQGVEMKLLSNGDSDESPALKKLKEIAELLQTQERHYREEQHDQAMSRQWELIAVVANRVFFLIYFLLTLIFTLWFIIRLYDGRQHTEIPDGLLPSHVEG